MDSEKLDKFIDDIEPYLITVIISSFVGVVCGVLGTLFLKTIDIFIDLRNALPLIIFLMPIIGIIIVYINKKYKYEKDGSILINNAITKKEDIPNYVTPTLFITTTLSHLAGASIGRMEAPIKIGGAIGNYISCFFKLTKERRNTVIASGLAALFSAIFGTPLTAIILTCEICNIKKNKKNIYIVPIILAASFARFVSFSLGIDSFIDKMLYLNHANFEIKQIILIVILIALCLGFALLFNYIFNFIKELVEKVKNEYLRIIIGSIIMIIAIILLDTSIFCGNDTNLVKQALESNEMWYTFLVKTILTALCLGIGFKGGNVGPAFISGATFGILMASLMGLDPMLGAAIGTITLFGGVTGCFISAGVLGIEIFGVDALISYLVIVLALRYLILNNYIKRNIL